MQTETFSKLQPGNQSQVTAFGNAFPEFPEGCMTPMLNTAIVACSAPEEKRGSIILPDTVKSMDEQLGQVVKIVSVGPLWYDRTKSKANIPDSSIPKPGDIVFLAKWAGNRFELSDVEGVFKFITDAEVLGVINNTEQYRPQFKLYA